MSDLIEYL